jgi:long-chain acyl-CoA synthetase
MSSSSVSCLEEWLRYFPLELMLQACNGHSIVCVPLYDTLGLDAVEFVANHAEITIAFVQESKLPSMIQALPKCLKHLKSELSSAFCIPLF